MSRKLPKVFTIDSGADVLWVIANAVKSKPYELHEWTILVPSRRAARELKRVFQNVAGQKSLMLPIINPIGDLDEDLLDQLQREDLPEAISDRALVFLIYELVQGWATTSSSTLAQDVSASRLKALGLAESLAQLQKQIKTEESSFEYLNAAYDLPDLANHREAILEVLNLLHEGLPHLLAREEKIIAAERRNLLIRREAKRIVAGQHSGPILAAGSTGTNPATTELLKAIAHYDKGLVVLPGLDRHMPDEDWLQLQPTHPQYGLSRLIRALEVGRDEIETLGENPSKRLWLASEMLRPGETTDKWKDVVKDRVSDFNHALKGVALAEAGNRHLEARMIALAMREVLDTPDKTAALITPDRDLGSRVKAELQRWNVVIDDTAGEPLSRYGLASLMIALSETIIADFSAETLVALLHHRDFNLSSSQQIIALLEMVVIRGQAYADDILTLRHRLQRARLEFEKSPRHAPDFVARMSENGWMELTILVAKIEAVLKPCASAEVRDFTTQLTLLLKVIASLSPGADDSLPENQIYEEVILALQADAPHAPDMTLAETAVVVCQALRRESFRAASDAHPRLAIYGLPEARMMRADLVILGGLNEGRWPEPADPGPWLNRPMRDTFKLAQPERMIGLTAHDFVEAFAQPNVLLTWSAKDAQGPIGPSRWLLRLKMLAQGFGQNANAFGLHPLNTLAKSLDAAYEFKPHTMPRPMPAFELRPRHFSVTDIEKLNRDPYSIYARKILKLNPVKRLRDETGDAALRGTIVHEALQHWNQRQPHGLSMNAFDWLMEEGAKAHLPVIEDPEVRYFWLERFRRFAVWMIANEPTLRINAAEIFAERKGKSNIQIGENTYTLTGIADRIDILDDGTARLIDYKTGSGSIPSHTQVSTGFSPQLTLEARMLERGDFSEISKLQVSELYYILASGGQKSGQLKPIKIEDDQIKQTWDGLLRKLALFEKVTTAYPPRSKLKSVGDKTDFDHLSRFSEWQLVQ